MKFHDPISNQTVDFKLPDDVNKILFNLSGGADSAIVFYMLVLYIIKEEKEVTIDFLTLNFDHRHRWQGRRAANIIEYFISKYDFSKYVKSHHTIFSREFHDRHIHPYQKEQFEKGAFDILIGGNNANPRWDTDIELKSGRHMNLWKENCPTIEGRNAQDIPDYEPPCGECWSCAERKLIWGDWNHAFVPTRKVGNHIK